MSYSLQNPITVTELNKKIKGLFQQDAQFQNFYIKGEIADLTWAKNGHLYFSLVDKNSKIGAVMFALLASRPNYRSLKNGDSIIVYGSVDLYLPAGRYSLEVYQIIAVGIGDKLLAKQALFKKLKEEGIFDIEKKKIPKYPFSIALICGKDSAAEKDFVTICSSRWPVAKISKYYSLVQGKLALPNLLEALRLAENNRHDVIVITRGGGSDEDLEVFNEEQLVRKIAQLNTPTISAIGHEIDHTLIDLVASVRASTPSNAAEIITPDIKEVNSQIKVTFETISRKFSYLNLSLKNKLIIIQQQLEKVSPIQILNKWNTDTTFYFVKITHLLSKRISTEHFIINNYFDKIKEGFERIYKQIGALIFKDDKIVKDVKMIEVNDKLSLLFQGKKVVVNVETIEEEN